MTSRSPIRLIHVGVGWWGHSWATDILSNRADVNVVAYVDMQSAMLTRLQKDIGVLPSACFASIEEALSAVDADAVLITSGLDGHVPLALAALQAGKHVLIEKPFAPSLREAQRVVAAAHAVGKIVMVSQNYRYYPAVQLVTRLIREQTFGSVGSVSIHFRKYANNAALEDNPHYQITQPLLLDMAIHHFDLMRYVLGQEATQVVCHAWNPSWSKFRQPAAATATILFSGGAVVNYQGSMVSTAQPTAWAGAWSMECEAGEIIWTSRDDFGFSSDKVVIHSAGEPERQLPLPPLPHWDRAGSLGAFVSAIRSGDEPECSGSDNLRSLALMFAAIEAAEQCQPILIPQP